MRLESLQKIFCRTSRILRTWIFTRCVSLPLPNSVTSSFGLDEMFSRRATSADTRSAYRFFRPIGSGSWCDGGRVEAAVVDEKMQFIQRKKECYCLSLDLAGASDRTHHEATLTDPAMQQQVCPQILHQFHRSCGLQGVWRFSDRDVFRTDAERDGRILRRVR